MQADASVRASYDEELIPSVMDATSGKPGIGFTQPGTSASRPDPAAHPPPPNLGASHSQKAERPARQNSHSAKWPGQPTEAGAVKGQAQERLQAEQLQAEKAADSAGQGQGSGRPPWELPLDHIAAEVQVRCLDWCLVLPYAVQPLMLAGISCWEACRTAWAEGQCRVCAEAVLLPQSACSQLGHAYAGRPAAEGGRCGQAGQGCNCPQREALAGAALSDVCPVSRPPWGTACRPPLTRSQLVTQGGAQCCGMSASLLRHCDIVASWLSFGQTLLQGISSNMLRLTHLPVCLACMHWRGCAFLLMDHAMHRRAFMSCFC